MQLQQNLASFEAAGIALFAISYDSVDALARFAEEFDVTFPLLSDEGSAVIREFGILNTLIRPEETEYYGLPYPGQYAVYEDGVVTEKQFHRYYRHRPTAQSVLKDTFDVAFDTGGDPQAEAQGPEGRISAVLSADALYFMQRAPLYVTLDLGPGLHVYRGPVPEGFVATEVSIDAPEDVQVEPAIYPEAHSFRVQDIPHEFQVMDGRVDIEVPLMVTVSETEATEPTIHLDVTVRYQACDEQQCFIPRTETLSLDIPRGVLLRRRPS